MYYTFIQQVLQLKPQPASHPTGNYSHERKCMARESIKIECAALDICDNDIVLRGIISPDSMNLLKFGDYQREAISSTKIEDLVKAFENGEHVPDIEIGVRGGNYRSHEDGSVFYLQDDAYVIDGKQRITSAMRLIARNTEKLPHLGATIYFNTTEEWERKRFKILNVNRTKVSVNVLIRNMRYEIPVVEMLYNLALDYSFVLQKRVSWSQNMQRGELITALSFLRVVGSLHSYFGSTRSSDSQELAKGVQTVMTKIGRTTMRDNIKTFFDIVDRCWGIRLVAFRDQSAWLRTTFLCCLADIFASYDTFWQGNRLSVDAQTERKLKTFPVHDPNIVKLASASGMSKEFLYDQILKYINSGRRTHRLEKPRIKKEHSFHSDAEPIEQQEPALADE